MGDEPKTTEHPYPPHAHDLVAVEVVWADGIVREGGKRYSRGEQLVIARSHCEQQNAAQRPAGKTVYRILRTVRYVNGPADQAEEAEYSGPLNVG